MKNEKICEQSMEIINLLFDLAEVPFEKRQQINNKANTYLQKQIEEIIMEEKVELGNIYQTLLMEETKENYKLEFRLSEYENKDNGIQI